MSTYKVRWWTSPTENTLFIFSDKKPTTLKEPHTWIPKMIYDDDNINTVTKKLVVYLKHAQSPHDLYLWCERSLEDTTKYHMYVLLHLFKKEKRIHYEQFQQTVSNLYGIQLANGDYNMINKETAFSLLEKHVPKGHHVIEPLSFHYVYDGFIEQICYDPRRVVKKQTTETFSVNNLSSHTLDSFHITDHTIHMKVYDKSSSVFFPFYKKHKTDIAALTTFVQQLDESESIIENHSLKNKFQPVDTFVSFMQFRCNENSFNDKVNLQTAFDQFHASPELPLIRLKTTSNIYYKIDKPSILSIPTKTLDKWTQMYKYSNTHTQLVFKLRFTTDSFCTVMITETLLYDVKFNIGVDQKTPLKTVFAFFDIINQHIIKPIQLLFDKNFLPFVHPSNITLTNLITYNTLALEKKTFKFQHLTSIISTKFFPYFSIISDDNNKVLTLQYKKVNNYSKYNHVEYFITSHFNLPKDVLVVKLMDAFVMSKEEAESEYDKWASKNEVEFIAQDDNTFQIKPKYDEFVNIKIKTNDNISSRFIISGIKDLPSHDRIVKLLTTLLDISMTETKSETKTNIDISAFDKQMFDTTTSSTLYFKDLDPTQEIHEDIDEDFLALEQEFAEDNKAEETGTVTPAAFITNEQTKTSAVKGKAPGPILGFLKSADKALFDYTPPTSKKRSDYPSICGWTDARQPMVITQQEKKRIDREYPGAIDDFVQTGSTPQLANRNIYVCPKIWCPKSRIAMTYDQYKKNNEKCPNTDEEPILFNKNYWGKEHEKALMRPHHIGFLKATTHPDGFCLPCCFKLPEKNKTKKNDGCSTNNQTVAEQSMTNVDEDALTDQGNEKYIKNENYSPLEPTRYGLPPKEFALFLSNKKCGNRHDGTGLIDHDTDCYLRRGVANISSQPFISCLLQVLKLPNTIKTPEQFSDLLSSMIDIETFLKIENGKMIRLFITPDFHIRHKAHVKEFKDWFLKQSKYIARFHLKKIEFELNTLDSLNITPDTTSIYKEIVREFTLYNSYRNFMAYIKDPSSLKDHRVLLDLVNTLFHETHIVIIQVDPTSGKTEILCPFNRSVKESLDLNASFLFLIKHNVYYEPIVHVQGSKKTTEFELDTCGPSIKSLISFYVQNCGHGIDGAPTTWGETVVLYLDAKGYKTRAYVLDYEYRICGILLKNNLYVPLQQKMDIPNIRGQAFVYINDVTDFKCTMNIDDIKEVFGKLETFTKTNFYGIDHVIEEKGNLVALRLKGRHSIVPLRLSKKSDLVKAFDNDLHILIGNEETDVRTKLMKIVKDHREQFELLFQECIEHVYASEKKKTEFEFLVHPSNPFPINFRRKKLLKLLASVVEKGHSEKMIGKIIERMLLNTFDTNRPFQQMSILLPNEVLLTQHDINNDKLQELKTFLQDPFRLLSERLDDMLENIMTNKDVSFKSLRRIYIHEETSSFQEVPVVWRKGLKGFEVLLNPDYNSLSLYTLFINVKEAIDPHTRFDLDILRSIVKSRIAFYYTTPEIQRFIENESFKAFLKVKDITKPPLNRCLEAVDSLKYYPSTFELHVLADIVGINVVLIGRKTQKNPDGLEVVDRQSKYTLIMLMSYDRVHKHDRFECFVKNKQILMFKNRDLPDDFLRIIDNKKKVYDIEVNA